MNLVRRKFLHLAVGAAAFPSVSRVVRAESYPSRPITMIVPFPAGAGTDTAARAIAEAMRRPLGQPVIIENVGGADGSIGVGRVARAKPDGYEIAMHAQENGLKEWLYLNGGDSGVALDRDFRGKGLQLESTVEDEGVFTTLWSANVTYRRALGVMPEMVCAENLRATYVAKDSAVPRADKPDF
jgi:hypothetical protein